MSTLVPLFYARSFVSEIHISTRLGDLNVISYENVQVVYDD